MAAAGDGARLDPASITLPTLRPYQASQFREAIQVAMKVERHTKQLIEAPTASGKTKLMTFMVGRMALAGRPTLSLGHTSEIVDQLSAGHDEAGIEHGLIRPGAPMTKHRAQVASMPTLAQRLDDVDIDPFVVFVDEAQHTPAASWARVLKRYEKAIVFGFSATPCRADGRPLSGFTRLIRGPTVRELTKLGYLASIRTFAARKAPKLEGVKLSGHDFRLADLEAAMMAGGLGEDAVADYARLKPGKPAIVFCTTRAHSLATAELFRQAGFNAVHVDAKTPAAIRAAAIADFNAGRIHVICNVGLFGEGINLPCIEVVILLRPTMSRALHCQMIGRGMRVSGKPHAVLLDHAGSCRRHGLPDHPHEWSLDGTTPTERPWIKQCPTCCALWDGATPACFECSTPFEVTPLDMIRARGRAREKERPWMADYVRGLPDNLFDNFIRTLPRLAYFALVRRCDEAFIASHIQRLGGRAA